MKMEGKGPEKVVIKIVFMIDARSFSNITEKLDSLKKTVSNFHMCQWKKIFSSPVRVPQLEVLFFFVKNGFRV